MRTVSINEVAEIVNGYAFDSNLFNTVGEGLPIARIRDIKPGFSETHYSGNFDTQYIIHNGALLIGMDGEFNIGFWKGGKALINQRVCRIIVKKEIVDEMYLNYRLGILLKEIEDNTPFVTVKHLSSEKLKHNEICLPPLHEQRRIAAILAKADRLRQLRRTARQLGDTFLQSVFVEMFYHKAENSWPILRIADLAQKGNDKIRTGPFGSQLLHSEFLEVGDIAVLGIDNAVQDYFTWGKPRYITHEKYNQLKRYTVYPNDVIITIMATTGRCAVVPDKIPLAINTKHLCCITLDRNKCLPSFLHASFLYNPLVLRQMGGSERGAIMPGLNMDIIKNLKITLPPLTLQERFAAIVRRYEQFRTQHREAERQAEMLFQSLLQRAFRGDI